LNRRSGVEGSLSARSACETGASNCPLITSSCHWSSKVSEPGGLVFSGYSQLAEKRNLWQTACMKTNTW
jgi:hypothetical protein